MYIFCFSDDRTRIGPILRICTNFHFPTAIAAMHIGLPNYVFLCAPSYSFLFLIFLICYKWQVKRYRLPLTSVNFQVFRIFRISLMPPLRGFVIGVAIGSTNMPPRWGWRFVRYFRLTSEYSASSLFSYATPSGFKIFRVIMSSQPSDHILSLCDALQVTCY